jgi:CubicO group peptidase (beta-lactamase class C family)
MTRRTFFAQLSLALRKDRVEQARAILSQAVARGEVRAAALWIHDARDTQAQRFHFGTARSVNEIFLLASITKPMTAAALMTLVDKNQVRLEDPVRRFIPEFTGGARDKVTLRHLLTHTSGLPDMLPENEALRMRNAPLSEFVAGACKVPLLFEPGTKVSYQSMGILLASEIAQRITKTPFAQFMRSAVYSPLGMKDTSLDLGGRKIADTALCEVSGNDTWNWNSPYWRNLGAPWGGAHSTTADVARFLEYFWQPDGRLMDNALASAMVTNQTPGLREAWGYGFRLGGHPKACSPGTYGHSGSTGTVSWADPKRRLSFVLLTTRPADQSRKTILTPVSEAASEAQA